MAKAAIIALHSSRLLLALVSVLWCLHERPTQAAEPFNLACGDNEVLAGIRGKAGPYWFAYVIEEVEPLCVSLHPSLAWTSWSPEPLGRGASTGPGDEFRITCPYGHAVFHINGTRGAWVDSLGVFCHLLTGAEEDDSQVLDVVGGNGSEVWESGCPSGQIGRGLSGTFGDVIDTLELECASVTAPPVVEVPSLWLPPSGATAESARPIFRLWWDTRDTPVRPARVSSTEFCLTSPAGFEVQDSAMLAK